MSKALYRFSKGCHCQVAGLELLFALQHGEYVLLQAMQFWRKAERVVQYKQQVVSNARKKEVMDKHLDFLVGQTQRYSTLLAQRLAGTSTT